MKITNLLTKAFIISALTLPFQAKASQILITNNDSADVTVLIEAGEGKVMRSGNEIKYTIKPKEQMKIDISKGGVLGDFDVFSVTGKVKVPSVYNKCSGLFENQDYEIVFVGSKLGGTICHAKQK